MTSVIKAEEPVLKTDGLGRVRTPVARRQQLLEEFDRSGLSGIKFAALVGVKYSTFAAWLHKRRHQQGGERVASTPVDSLSWLEAVVEQAQSSGGDSGLMVEFASGARAQIRNVHQAVLAAALVRALEKPC